MAANPVFKSCPKDVWTIVATAVVMGKIKRVKKDPLRYLETYRVTGTLPPLNFEDGLPAFVGSDIEPIESDNPIDIYIMAVGKDGEVRVDL
jgi:hypothetical protein